MALGAALCAYGNGSPCPASLVASGASLVASGCISGTSGYVGVKVRGRCIGFVAR